MVIDSEVIKNVNGYMRNKYPDYRDKWEGPFRLAVPSLGIVVQIYGKVETYRQEQEKILAILKEKERGALG